MAHVIGNHGDPFIAASAVGQFMAVVRASGVAERVMAPSTLTGQPFAGLTLATAASPGRSVAVAGLGRHKAIAAASIAAGRPVTAGSINGALVEFVPGAATSANLMRHFVGYAVQNAGPGDVFTVDVTPQTSL